MAECRYCAFARCHDGDPIACAMALVMPRGEHACPAYEREPGSDDDKGKDQGNG